MPEQISVEEFLKECWDDYHSPTTSNFVSKMGQCRNTVTALEETLDYDRSGLNKMKKSIKALHSSGNMHVHNETYLSENMEKLGASALHRNNEEEIGKAFFKFAVIQKELSALMKNLMQNLNNILMFPLDSFLKGDLKGVKGDLKKPFDKASKDYDAKFNKLEKEKKQLAKEAGMIKTEVTAPEVAEELERERRVFQLQTCEYLVKVNEIKTKKGVDLLQHLVEFYQAQTNYFQDGMKTMEHFKIYIEDMVKQLAVIKPRQDEEKRKLCDLREALKSSMTDIVDKEHHHFHHHFPHPNRYSGSPNTTGYNLHQLQGNKDHGFEKRGYLLKKSENQFVKKWQKRSCSIKDGKLSIGHSDTTKEPVRLNLLTCQVKLVHDDPGKKCFDLISSLKNRTYHFQAEDTADMEEWISVLNNAKEKVLMVAVTGESSSGTEPNTSNQSVRELTQTIIQEVRRLPGNNLCCDCLAADPEWLSVNLGVLICLECCGVHRDMGVHISRTQSIVIDDIGTSKLLVARVMSNDMFNEVYEATLDESKRLIPASPMEEKKTYIRDKYIKRKYCLVTTTEEERRYELKQAVLCGDLCSLLQLFADGVDFMEPLPETENQETALHLAIMKEDGRSVYIVDFIIQNTNSQYLHRKTKNKDTVLHYCAKYNQTECMKLVLRALPELVNVENGLGQTPLEVARAHNNSLCMELINHALDNKTELFMNVNIEWDLFHDDRFFDTVDYSDDDLDGPSTPDRKSRSRPGSLIFTGESLETIRDRPMSELSQSQTLKPPKVLNLPPTNLSGSGTLTKGSRKGPAPPPPPNVNRHTRHVSDTSFTTPVIQTHVRSPSDPPPIPTKTKPPAGAKLVLPPPPAFRQEKPPIAPRPASMMRPKSMGNELEDSRIPTNGRLNGKSKSIDSLDSTDSSLGNRVSSVSTISELKPVPTPRIKRKAPRQKRCRTLYDCEADEEDELSFKEGEIIIVIKEEEDNWWEGQIEGEPKRRGMFPVKFVHMIGD